MTDHIIVKNARTHNLKGINISVPKNKIVVFTGISGSGKSSLVFDTIYTESQRQLIETFSSFARQRLPKLTRPPVDDIKNISTAIIIDQKRMGHNLRSTLGTATEISTYLRMLYSRFGKPFIGPSFLFSFNHPEGMCPDCKGLGKQIEVDIDLLLDKSKSIREGAVNHPDYRVGGWMWREMVASDLFDVDKPIKDFAKEEYIKLVYTEEISIQKKHGAGIYSKMFEGVARKLLRRYVDKAQDEEQDSKKDAYQRYFIYKECEACEGSRISDRARSVILNNKNIAELMAMELQELCQFLQGIQITDAKSMLDKMISMLTNLVDIGVGYLSLRRPVSTLSGGESQRVKMARQLDCDLVDMIYVLDEPSIGLHARDDIKIIKMLKNLRDKGNSVLVVEHDPEIIEQADWIIDLGPKSGINGGEVVFEGSYTELIRAETITAEYLKLKNDFAYNRKPWKEYFLIENANLHNLKNISIKIPRGIFTCITGVAGSGKSSLINGEFLSLYPDAIVIDQQAVSRSSRSIPVTYIGVFDHIRKEIAAATSSSPALFSFNSHGACEKCKGMGYITVDMNFLDDIKITCDECNGERFKKDVLELRYKGKNIFEILNMSVQEAIEFFDTHVVKKRLQILADTGLDYMDIGQSLSSLSGGEAQRIKIAAELHKKGNLYILDEPSTGLHLADIEKLLKIIRGLTANNNTVVVIEHNLDIIKQADWIIDMGPEGGSKGGYIMAEGTPEIVANNTKSITGKYLRKII